MKTIRRLIALALVLGSAHASAEWTAIHRFEDDTRIYVDRRTARRDGHLAQVRHLVRWGEPQVDPGMPPYLSTVVVTAYDCVTKREKYLGSTSFSGAMGDGATVVSDEDEAPGWASISDGSMEEKLWKIACGID